MQKFINGALAGCLALTMLGGSAALAKSHGHGSHGHGARGNSAMARSCVNPAGNIRGWCKGHGGTFVTGTVSAINGSRAIITLTNGQTVTVRDAGGLTVGQTVTLRGNYAGNGSFTVTNPIYTNYPGPFTGATVSGVVLSVNGNAVQILSGLRVISINDANAAVNGGIYVGRSITATGNWNGNVFYANSIQ